MVWLLFVPFLSWLCSCLSSVSLFVASFTCPVSEMCVRLSAHDVNTQIIIVSVSVSAAVHAAVRCFSLFSIHQVSFSYLQFCIDFCIFPLLLEMVFYNVDYFGKDLTPRCRFSLNLITFHWFECRLWYRVA